MLTGRPRPLTGLSGDPAVETLGARSLDGRARSWDTRCSRVVRGDKRMRGTQGTLGPADGDGFAPTVTLMCEHCGCRGVTPIAELMDEHLLLLELGGTIRRHLLAGDVDDARSTLRELASRLSDHVRLEEQGLFAAMKAQGDFVDAVTELEAEHSQFDAALAMIDRDRTDFELEVFALLDELVLHIDKENLGVFPVAVVSLGASGWDTVSRAHDGRDPAPAMTSGAQS